MNYRILHLLFFLVLVTSAFSQQGAINGKVTDTFGNRIETANVSLQGTTLGSSTNAAGNFSIGNIPIGQQTVTVSFIGYETMQKTVLVEANQTLQVDFQLSPSSENLSEVIVTGNRETGYVATEQSGATFGSRAITDIPLSVTVITQEVLLDQQVRSLGDLVRNDPSTIVSNPPGFNETVNIRGYNLDNSSSYRRENLIFQNQVQSPFENKAAVDLVKGPAAIRYGFTPPGGIVNYVLKRPTATPYSFVQAFGDSYGSAGIHGDFGGKVNEKFGYRLNTVISKEAAFVDGVSGPRQMFSAFFEWQATDKLQIDIEGEYQYRELEQQSTIGTGSFDPSLSADERKALLDNFDPTTFLGQQWGTYPTRNFVGSIGATYNISEDWNAVGRVQKMNLIRDQKGAGILGGSLQANGDFESTIYFGPSQVRDPLSLEAFINGKFKTLGVKNEISIGGAYSHNPLIFTPDVVNIAIGTSNIFNPVNFPLPDVTAGPSIEALVFTQKAFFITDFIGIGERLEIMAGLRYTEQENEDAFNDEEILQTTYKDHIISPSLGIIYKPLNEISVYGSYSTGVTNGLQIPTDASNFGEDIFLDPVETEQLEMGFKAELFKKALLTAAVFDIDQPLAFIDNNNLFRYGGSQHHRGAELTLAGQLTDDLRIIAGGLYLDAEIDNPSELDLNGKRPAGVPEFQANLFIDYALSMVKGLDINGGLFYTGDRFADNFNTFEVDGYARLDLGARYAFSVNRTKLTARLNLRNLTDKKFIEGTAFGSFYYGSPRAAIFSLAAEF